MNSTKIPLRPVALALSLAFSGAACALDFKLYVSEKISHSKIKIEDSVVHSLPPVNQPTVYGINEKDNVIGSKTAIGFALPVSTLRGSIRAEFEFGFNEKVKFNIANKAFPEQFFDTKIRMQTYFINAYYDLDTGTAFTPYIGIGAGIANIKSKAAHDYGDPGGPTVVSGSERTNNFAWNTSLGGTYAFNKNLSFDVSYRYTDFGNLDGILTSPVAAYKSKAKLSSHEVLAGIRYSF
jgi:opacity protein-like surface antigen